jgi:hypothetical protein
MKGDITIQPYGSIRFNSNVLVDGTVVTVDGADQELDGKVLVLPVGERTVVLTAPAKRALSKEVDVRAGRPYKWTTRLSRAKPGRITFEITGPEAFVLTVDSVETDPSAATVLATGRHQIGVSADGWDPIEATITVTEREARTVSYTLTPTPIELTVSPLPDGARIFITPKGGEAAELSGDDGSLVTLLPPDGYSIRVEAPDRVSFTRTLVIHIGDRPHRIEPDMPATLVEVTWMGLPSGAALFLEEPGAEPRQIRISDGVAHATVPAGDVAWRVEKSGYLTVADILELKPGDEPQEIAVELPVDAVLRGRIRTIAMAGAAGGTGIAGIVLLGASAGSYADATAQHELYLSSRDPNEIVTAKAAREDALGRGEGQQIAGVILTSIGVGTAAATVLLMLLDKPRHPEQIGAIVVPTDGGVAFVMTGRW